MMLILVGAGQVQFQYVLGLSVVVVALLVVVTFSYRQTIRAYPTAAAATSSPTRTWASSPVSWRRLAPHDTS